MNRSSAVALVTSCALIACGGPAATGGSPAPAPEPTRAASEAELALTYAPAREGARRFPSPLVDAWVGNVKTKAVLDTGAQASAIADTVARAAGLPLVDSDSGAHDPSGAPLPIKVTTAATWTFESFGTLRGPPVIVIPLPPPLVELGIGAIFSVQSLATERESVVMDLPNGRLVRAPRETVEARWGSFGVRATGTRARVCTVQFDKLVARMLVMTGTLDGEPTTFEIDTGASNTVVVRDSPAGRAIARRTAAASGAALGAAGLIPTTRYADVPLQVGELRASGDVLVTAGTRDESCGWDARIGMDILRRCVLVIGTTSLDLRCAASP